jgi:hypothetical protein
VLREAQTVLAHRGLDHATIQIELPDGVRECAPDC